MAQPTSDWLTGDIQAVVLDLDGTLYDKHHLPLRLVLRNLLSLSLLAVEQKTRKALRGQFFGSEEQFYQAFFEQMAKGHLFSPRIARAWYFGKYMPSMVRALRHYRPRPWVSRFLADCRNRHLKVVVYSDYGFVERKLYAIGLHADMFDFVVSAPALGGLKPAHECAIQVAERLNTRPENCLFIGDRTDTDGASAKAIGAKFYLVG